MTVEEILEKCEQDLEVWTALRCVAMLNWAPWNYDVWKPWDQRFRKLTSVGTRWSYPEIASKDVWNPRTEPFSKLFKNPAKPEES